MVEEILESLQRGIIDIAWLDIPVDTKGNKAGQRPCLMFCIRMAQKCRPSRRWLRLGTRADYDTRQTERIGEIGFDVLEALPLDVVPDEIDRQEGGAEGRNICLNPARMLAKKLSNTIYGGDQITAAGGRQSAVAFEVIEDFGKRRGTDLDLNEGVHGIFLSAAGQGEWTGADSV